ncbi:ion channel [Methylobacter sp. sgz302048]|uniref:ion channel n=1 Tax=Methylobacter sp. sgz302048 TaxID=3455945 RepID=UPI003F9F53A9
MPVLNQHPKPDNYAYLLSGLLFLFLLVPTLRSFPDLAENAHLMRLGLQIGYSTLMLLGVWSLHRETRLFYIGMALAVLNVLFTVINVYYPSRIIELSSTLVAFVFAIISVIISIRHVLGGTTIDRNLLFGAMCVYLLMGLIWAILYGLIFQFWPGSLNGIADIHGNATLDNLLYYSFVTLAGLGYGDITPVVPLARTLAYLEVIAGQLYIAIMLAGLVSLFLSGRGVR